MRTPKTKLWSEIRDKRSKLSPAERAEIKAAAKLESERYAKVTKIDQLRRARRLTQAEMAAHLGSNQGAVSRLERQQDLYLSTLGRFVHAMGGTVRIVVEFEDSIPIELDILGDLDPPRRARPRARSASRRASA